MQQRNQTLAHAAAERHAERELRAEDAKAIREAEEDWQRVKLTKEQTESFATRVKERIPAVEKRLLARDRGERDPLPHVRRGR